MKDVAGQDSFECIAIIVAGGKGLRMQSDQKKQFIELDGVPVLIRTLRKFDRHKQISSIILVVPESDLHFCTHDLICPYTFNSELHIIKGGTTRQDSVNNGLAKAQSLCAESQETLVLVHDNVRPFVNHEMIDKSIAVAKKKGACIPAIQISDTVKEVDTNGQVCRTISREKLFRAQTPQVFQLPLILEAMSNAQGTGFSGTDEASLCEHLGIPVHVVEGDRFNIKLTTPEDLTLARYFLSLEE